MKAVFFALSIIVSVIAQNPSIGLVKIQGTINDPTVVGYVAFYLESNGNITMAANITGITKNLNMNHGLHVHQYGDLSTNDGNSVASHLNPNNSNHGCPENGGARHLGDTGNWMVNADGTILFNKTLDLMSVTGTYSIIGYALVLHLNTDDCNSTTSSAARLAQGVIGVANPTPFGATQNMAKASSGALTTVSDKAQAVCVLQGATKQNAEAADVTGFVWFTQTANGVAVSAVVNGLSGQYPRGFHVHQWGDISSATAAAAGPHWTGPLLDATVPHSIPGYTGKTGHIGDMGNIFTFDSTNNGSAYYYNVITTFGIFGDDVNSILGRAIVVHNLTDDCQGTNGFSGARIAQCVIGVANPAFAGARDALTGVPSAQDYSNCTPAVTSATAPAEMTSGTVATSTSTSAATSTGNATVTSTSTTTKATTTAKATTTGGGANNAGAIVLSVVLVAAMLFA